MQVKGAKGGHVIVEEVESKVWCCQVEIKIDQTLVILIRLLNDEFTPFIHGWCWNFRKMLEDFSRVIQESKWCKIVVLKGQTC